MSAVNPALIQAFEFQAEACAKLGSPFSQRVLRAVLADIQAGGPFAGFAATWSDASFNHLLAEAVPLRFLGGLHYLALSGRDAALAAVYPPRGRPDDSTDLSPLLARAATAHAATLRDFLAGAPQTNEVRRCLCLVGGFLDVARRTGLPLRCLELGSSAGLNLNWDRYGYDLGALGRWGDQSSSVRLSCEWSGAAPAFDVPAQVVERRGCDQAPLDVADVGQAQRLLAYVWPDQGERMARTRAAIEIARASPPSIAAQDAGAWASAHAHPRPGVASVLFHSVVWSYLPAETRRAVRRAIAKASESANPSQPFAWLRMEPSPADPTGLMEVRVTIWPDGAERLLGRVHPHGAKVFWLEG
jgi:hypothetical protein